MVLGPLKVHAKMSANKAVLPHQELTKNTEI